MYAGQILVRVLRAPDYYNSSYDICIKEFSRVQIVYDIILFFIFNQYEVPFSINFKAESQFAMAKV